MVAVYCDVCGKRIDIKLESRYKLTCYEVSGKIPMAEYNTLKQIYNNDDICEECIDKINNHISDLKNVIPFTKDGD